MKKIVGLAALLAAAPICAEDIQFRDALAQAAAPEVQSINIDIDQDNTLVFSGGDRVVLHGKRLFVSAQNVRVEDDFVIQQFDQSNVPAPSTHVPDGVAARPRAGRDGRHGRDGQTGRRGLRGQKGEEGSTAPLIFLEIGNLTGSGTLTVVNDGAQGGRGGIGGRGGTGGQGGSGKKGDSGTFQCNSGGGDGGDGGRGGRGGDGGTGGNGGDGGQIMISPAVAAAVERGRVILTANGGAGGTGGPGGPAGNPGSGGERGRGDGHCGGGSSGSRGPAGGTGNAGNVGASGNPGEVITIP